MGALGAAGGVVELRYRDAVAAAVRIGPSAIYEIPLRFVAVGPGLAPTPEIERAVDLRLAQANAVWEPFGRRFKRRAIVRLDGFPGLVLVRGRAAGADGRGRPSRCGILLDGKDVSVAASWKDGVEMVFSSETDAAMVPAYIAQTYPNLVPVATSRTSRTSMA